MIKFNNFKATPRLQFRMFKKDVVIEFRNIVTASLEVYFSLGGIIVVYSIYTILVHCRSI